jgi:hypothetical protein
MRRRDPLEGMSPGPARPALSHEDEIRRRQRSRATVTGLALAAFAILLFAITIVRIGNL